MWSGLIPTRLMRTPHTFVSIRNTHTPSRSATAMYLFIFFGLWISACQKEDVPVVEQPLPTTVVKTNPTKIFMHYMPWFHSKDISGYWGIHWTMANKNPDLISASGKRDIAAHYYPLVGPYDSADPVLIDYHLLLMKYTGIDGVLIDWYGAHDILDYGSNLKNTNAFIEGAKAVGIPFGIVYEEYTTEQVAKIKNVSAEEAARQDLLYAQQYYFTSKHYILFNNKPLVLTFGPRFLTKSSQWSEILGALNKPISFMPLWNLSNLIGSAAVSGEYSWIDFSATLDRLQGFYQANTKNRIIGSAYPGFHDYYTAGGWGSSYGVIDHKDGETLRNTLGKASAFQLPYIQLATWNDFGEGTMLEPTDEFQFRFLEIIQQFAGVPYTKKELELIHTYYTKRKALRGVSSAQQTLDAVFDALNTLNVAKAKQLLDTL